MDIYGFVHANGEIVERFEFVGDFSDIQLLYSQMKEKYDKKDGLFCFDLMLR